MTTETNPNGEISANMSEPFIALSTALVEVQGALEPVRKDGKNPQFKSRYATLDNVVEAIQPHLHAHGLAVIFFPIFRDNLAGVSLQIRHKSGGSMDCGELLLPLGRSGGAQGAGSSLTYARRYMLCAVFNLALDDDDDGNGAQKAHREAKKATPKPQASSKPAEAPEPFKGDVLDIKAQSAIQAGLKKLADDKGLDSVHAVLGKFKVEKVAQLPADSFDAVLSAIEEASK